MAGRPHPQQTPQKIAERAERNRRWFEMLRGGMTQAEIAYAEGVSKQTVNRAINECMQEARDALFTETEMYRALQLERLGALLNAIWDSAMLGSDKAIDAARRVIADITKLTVPEVTVNVQIGESDVDRTLRQLDQLLNDRARAIEGEVVAGPGEAIPAEAADG